MAGPERAYRTSENDEELLAGLEHINQDENPLERERKLNILYEQLAEQEANELPYEQGGEPSKKRE